MPTNHENKKKLLSVFECHAGGDTRLRQALLSASQDSRISDVVIVVADNHKGLENGSHKLADVLLDLSGGIAPNNKSKCSGSVLGESDCSSLEVLDNAAAILHQMAGTPWLALVNVSFSNTQQSALVEGSYDAQDFLKGLAIIVDKAFNAKMANPNISFANSIAI